MWGADCSDEEPCQQVLDGSGVLKPDLQMCKPPGIQISAVLKDSFGFTENVAKAPHLARLNFLG